MLTAFIASQLIGVRREVIELNAREKYSKEDDEFMGKVLMFFVAFIVGPLVWPVGMYFNTGIRQHKWLIAPLALGAIFTLAVGFWFYVFVGFFWTVYALITFEYFVDKYKTDQARPVVIEELPLEDQEVDVIVKTVLCTCGCDEKSEKVILRPR